MSELFGFLPDGRKDTSRGIVPTSEGYDRIYAQVETAIHNGNYVDPNDPSIARLATYCGKTVKDLLSGFGQH